MGLSEAIPAMWARHRRSLQFSPAAMKKCANKRCSASLRTRSCSTLSAAGAASRAWGKISAVQIGGVAVAARIAIGAQWCGYAA